LQRYDLGVGDFAIETHVGVSGTVPGMAYIAGLALSLQHPVRIVFDCAKTISCI
jgi:hypothetical protein